MNYRVLLTSTDRKYMLKYKSGYLHSGYFYLSFPFLSFLNYFIKRKKLIKLLSKTLRKH